MSNSVAIVTGASQGIGRATAIRLARDFSALVLVARNRASLEETAAAVTAAGAKALVIDADLGQPEAAQAVVDRALAAFGRIGFPFTRLADLSQTAVVLPDQPKVQELSAYLDLLGRLGESTGYPGTGIEVVRSAQVDSVAAKDLLLIASGDNQPLLKSWAGAMPAGLDDGQRSGLPGLFDQALAWLAGFLPESLKAEPASQFSSKGMNAFAAGFESPLRSGRSVVLLWGADPNGLQAGIGALLGEDLLVSKISGSLAVLRGQQVEMLNSKPTYHVGDLDWFTQARMNLSGNFALLLLIGAYGALLLALPARAVLRAQANRRSSK